MIKSRAIILVFVFLIIGVGIYLLYLGLEDTEIIPDDGKITNFEQCAAAGNPVMESYPRQCRADGQTFVEEIDDMPATEDETIDVNQKDLDPLDDLGNSAQLANPASVYCEQEGGEIENREFEDGTAGFCLFEDGSECGQWAFYRNECNPGQNFCKDMCGDGRCDEVVCEAVGCPCGETPKGCPADCRK